MSEQTIQNGLYSTPVTFYKYTCISLGATTIKDLVASNKISGITPKESESIKAKKPDVLILNTNKEIVVFIEMKDPAKLKTSKLTEKAIRQEINVAKKTKAKIYIVSDGNTFVWINPKTEELIIGENGEPVDRKINPKELTEEEQKSLADFIDDVCFCIDETNNQLLPKNYLDPTDLARATSKILQKMTLSTAKNSLYTFVELFTFKFLSDIGVLKNLYSFDHVYEIYETVSGKDAFNYYLTTIRTKLLELFPRAEDNTTIINGRIFHATINEKNEPVFAESAADCFGRLLESFKDYEKKNGKFIYIHKDFKSKLFETFMKHNSEKSGMGKFFTPLKVVQEMVRMVEIKPGMKICDPACGVGKFLLEASSKINYPFYFENGILKSSVELVGLEKRMEDDEWDLTTILAKCNTLIYYSDLFKDNCDSTEKIKILANSLLNKIIVSSQTTLGTLGKLVPNIYDLILANPPYYQDATINNQSKTIKIGDSEENAYTANGKGLEGLFTEWIIKSLKQGGVANIILPDGLFTNIGNSKLKKLILKECIIESIISLPLGTFFNTPKKTFIFTIKKKISDETQTFPVFCYLCSSIGETLDARRDDNSENNDLHTAVNLYNLYKGNKDNPIAINAVSEDPRAKLIKIDEFGENSNWFIDNFWSNDEKVALGVKKQDNTMTLSEFKDYIQEVNEEIVNYLEAIECLNTDL